MKCVMVVYAYVRRNAHRHPVYEQSCKHINYIFNKTTHRCTYSIHMHHRHHCRHGASTYMCLCTRANHNGAMYVALYVTMAILTSCS